MMMSDSQRALTRNYGTLIGRILMGLLFFFSGLMMVIPSEGVRGVTQVAGMIGGLGFPASMALAWLIVGVKVLGGGALMLGYRVGCASVALIAFTLSTIVFVHANYMEDINFFKNFAIIGGLLYVLAYGPGEGWSLSKHAAAASTNTPNN